MKIQLGRLNDILKYIGLQVKVTHPEDENDPTPTDIIIRSRKAYEREMREKFRNNLRRNTYRVK